ncbi:MAG: hypothetical protein ACR2M1_06040 [Gemmatimonadaceae bacterium]
MSDSMSLFPNDSSPSGRPERTALHASRVARNAEASIPANPAPAFGVRIRDAATNIYAEHIINIVTGALGFTVIHARVPFESTLPLNLPTGTPNDDIINESDSAERNGGIVSIDVTDETQFFIGSYSNPIRLYGEDGVAAVRDFLDRTATEAPPPTP